MSDRIFINGLSLHAYHGVMAYEAKVGQTFTIDLELEIDLADAARSDKVADTVSYDTVVDCASRAFCDRRCRLIEAAAGQVVNAVEKSSSCCSEKYKKRIRQFSSWLRYQV